MHRLRLLGISWAFLAFMGCSVNSSDQEPYAVPQFSWNDRARPLSYPGPMAQSDSLMDLMSLRVVANLAHGELDSILLRANDSLFVALSEDADHARLIGMDQIRAWRQGLGKVRYQAFNVRGAYNQGSASHIAYVFGRLVSEDQGDQYHVFALAWNRSGKLTGLVSWRSPWPKSSRRQVVPARMPEQFHFYSATRLGSDSAALKSMDFTTAIYRNNLRLQRDLLADTVEYHDAQGQFGYFSRTQVVDLLDHRTKDHVHHNLRYTSVIPWDMLRFGREMAAVVTYEDWEDKGTKDVKVYSFCRLYFFDNQGKINNFVFTRRLVHPVGRYPLVE